MRSINHSFTQTLKLSSCDLQGRDVVIMYNSWEELENGIKECQKCKLHSTRKNIVFGTRK